MRNFEQTFRSSAQKALALGEGNVRSWLARVGVPQDGRTPTKAHEIRASATPTIDPWRRLASHELTPFLAQALATLKKCPNPMPKRSPHAAELHNVGRGDTKLQNCADLLLSCRSWLRISGTLRWQRFDDSSVHHVHGMPLQHRRVWSSVGESQI